MTEFLLPVLAYLILLTIVAKASQRAGRFATFSVADRKVPTAMVAATVVGTYVGPGFSMGWIGKGAQYGYLYAFVGLAYVIQTILVGLVVAPRLRQAADCHTLGDYFGIIYGRKAKFISGIVSVGICAGFSAVMVKAGAILLADTFKLPPMAAALILVVITTIYTTLGGLRASVTTDAFQFAFFGMALSTVLAFVVYQNWPASEIFTKAAWGVTRGAISELGAVGFISLLVVFFLGETLIPPYATRIFAAKSDDASRLGFFFSGLYGIPWFLMMVFIGIQLAPLLAADTPPDAMLVHASRQLFPAWLGGFVFAALFAIIMSSLTSLLNSGAVSLTRDVFGVTDDTRRLPIARWATVGLSAISFVGGVLVPGLVEGLILCYTVWAPAILPSIIFSLFLRKPRPAAALLSISVGALSAVVWHLGFEKATGVEAVIPALVLSVIGFGVGQALASPKAKTFAMV